MVATTGAASSACLTLVEFIVSLSYFDAFVHSTPLAAVSVLFTVVHHTLVPPFVQFDASSECCQLECV